jgi:hypothetical protein
MIGVIELRHHAGARAVGRGGAGAVLIGDGLVDGGAGKGMGEETQFIIAGDAGDIVRSGAHRGCDLRIRKGLH